MLVSYQTGLGYFLLGKYPNIIIRIHLSDIVMMPLKKTNMHKKLCCYYSEKQALHCGNDQTDI